MGIKELRCENLRVLAKSVGGISALADKLKKSQSQISQLIGAQPSKNIGDKFAYEVEQTFKKPEGWLDKVHVNSPFIATAALKVPILDWNEIDAWTLGFSQKKIFFNKMSNGKFLLITGKINPKSFGLIIRNDCMVSATDTSFTTGSYIIVDPDAIVTNLHYVLLTENNANSPVLRQWVQDGSHIYLKPLNTKYPIIVLNEPYILHGVVRQMIHFFT